MTHPDHEAFAQRWAETIVGTSYVPIGRRALAKHLLGLTPRLVEATLAAEFDASIGHQIGVDMVAAHFTGTETLSKTLALIAEELPGLLDCPPGLNVASRIAQLVGSMAAGYAGALRERSLDEQDAIYRAGLRARQQAEQALAASEAKFRAMFTEAAIGIGIGDLQGNITDANPALQQMFGYTLEELTQFNVRSMVHPEDASSVWETYGELIRGERDHFRLEKRYYRADGGEIWTHVTVFLVREEAGEPAYQVAMLEDVSERRRLQDRLQHQAYHDPLTKLANRAMVTDRLGQIFAVPAGLRRVGLCFLDLDGFKVVNDSLGHDVGDQLLIAVASRLNRCCDSGQMVARMGGDEFVIIVEDTAGEHDVAALADEVLAAMAAPIRVGDHELTVTTSIGVVERPVADTNPADLMQAADITLYRAKAEGKARYAMFDQHRNDSEVARFTLSATLLAAIDRGEFFLDYQPLVALKDGTLRGVEALVRWRHPTLGVLGPERFISLAEETGSIVQLGHWVLARACQQARAWRDAFGDAAPLVSVNLAPRQLNEPALVAEVATILADNDLDPSCLQLELTEQCLMGDEPGPLKALTKLYHMGVRIAIDDFGTGYSNFSYLRRLPMHELKLAGSFAVSLRSPDADLVDEQIVATLVSLAHALELTVTAEGVETDLQRERFGALGCDSGQGSLFGLPGTPEQIDTRLRAATSLCGLRTKAR
ncbi:MAG: EAL domain-containing protein [Actinomycetota bacterium]|nr:EAL domain-containing protein [Actinomycetota bacterium]